MKKIHGRLTFKIFSLIILSDVLESFAELCFKKGALNTGIDNVTFGNFFHFTLLVITTPGILCGAFLYSLNFLVWILVLSRVDLSVAFPLGSATYVLVPLLSIVFLHEKVALLRWLGIAFIIMGVYFISKSTHILEVKNEP